MRHNGKIGRLNNRPPPRRREVDIEDAVAWAFFDEQAHRANGGYEGRLSWSSRSGCGILALEDVRVQGSGVAGMLTSSSTPIDAETIVRFAEGMVDAWLLRHYALTGGRPAYDAAPWILAFDRRESPHRLPMPPGIKGLVENAAGAKFCRIEIYVDEGAVRRLRREYSNWIEALAALARILEGKLETMTVLPPGAPARPWIAERPLEDARRLGISDGTRDRIIAACRRGEAIAEVARLNALTHRQVKGILERHRTAQRS